MYLLAERWLQFKGRLRTVFNLIVKKGYKNDCILNEHVYLYTYGMNSIIFVGKQSLTSTFIHLIIVFRDVHSANAFKQWQCSVYRIQERFADLSFVTNIHNT